MGRREEANRSAPVPITCTCSAATAAQAEAAREISLKVKIRPRRGAGAALHHLRRRRLFERSSWASASARTAAASLLESVKSRHVASGIVLGLREEVRRDERRIRVGRSDDQRLPTGPPACPPRRGPRRGAWRRRRSGCPGPTIFATLRDGDEPRDAVRSAREEHRVDAELAQRPSAARGCAPTRAAASRRRCAARPRRAPARRPSGETTGRRRGLPGRRRRRSRAARASRRSETPRRSVNAKPDERTSCLRWYASMRRRADAERAAELGGDFCFGPVRASRTSRATERREEDFLRR